MSMVGHNGGPAFGPRNFKKRWAMAVFAHPEKPMGAVAMAFKLYMEMDSQGCGAVISDKDFMESCGVSDGSCRVFKRWLVKEHFIEILVHGRRGVTSKFKATLPAEYAAYQKPNNRQRSPVIENELPATAAANQEQPAYSAAYPGSLKESFPHTPFKENNNNINNLASVRDNNSAREAGQLAILNGAKALMVAQLGAWISPYSPDTETAEKWLTTATTMHGGPVVKQAFSELQAQIASGDLIGRPIVVLNRICERIKKRPAQNREGKSPSRDEAMRLISTIAGGKR